MLYRPPVRHSLNTLIAWMETKDPEERYNFTDPTRCLLAQYFNEYNLNERDYSWEFVSGGYDAYKYISFGNGRISDWKFGRAMERAKKWHESHPVPYAD